MSKYYLPAICHLCDYRHRSDKLLDFTWKNKIIHHNDYTPWNIRLSANIISLKRQSSQIKSVIIDTKI